MCRFHSALLRLLSQGFLVRSWSLRKPKRAVKVPIALEVKEQPLRETCSEVWGLSLMAAKGYCVRGLFMCVMPRPM